MMSRARPEPASRMPPDRLHSRLLLIGFVLLGVFVVGAGGAAPRYNRIGYGAVPLALALICFGGVAYSHRADGRRRVIALCCWLLAVAVLAIWFRPSLAGAVAPEPRIERSHVLLTLPRDRLRTELFAEIQPIELANCRLERFGDRNDGGYLMCGNLLGSIRAAYSYGIAGRDQWGCDVVRKFQVPLHQYDCFDLAKPACPGGPTVFHAECIGSVRRADAAGRLFDTLENQLTRNGDDANRVVVKMDVEGAEWDTLLRAPAAVLERIDQLVLELHGIGVEHHLSTVRRLKKFFHVAHLHFNNYKCAERIDPFPSTVYEVLFVSKRLATTRGPAAATPHPLDAPNHPRRPDCQIATSRWSHVIPGALR
jgi:hypothetical protein